MERESVHYPIGAVSRMTGVPARVLRRWETRLPSHAAPDRTIDGFRTYSADCVERIRTLNLLVRQKGMSLAGAVRLIEEEDGGSPKTLARKILRDEEVSRAVRKLAAVVCEVILENRDEHQVAR